MNHKSFANRFLQRKIRPDDADAFLPDPYKRRSGPPRVHSSDALAEALADAFLAAATSAEEVTEDIRDELTTEELGGPFVETSAGQEFGRTVEEHGPVGGSSEAFPTAHAESPRGPGARRLR